MHRLVLRENKKVRPIQVWIETPDDRGPTGLWTLGMRWLGDPKFIEIRGTYDVDESSPFQQAIDRLPGPLVGGELMAGNLATVTDKFYKDAYPVLVDMLSQQQ